MTTKFLCFWLFHDYKCQNIPSTPLFYTLHSKLSSPKKQLIWCAENYKSLCTSHCNIYQNMPLKNNNPLPDKNYINYLRPEKFKAVMLPAPSFSYQFIIFIILFLRSCQTGRCIAATCLHDKMTHMTWCCNMCCNELPIKMASQGRPTIGLFTGLSQQHATWACHMRGPNVCATFCCCNVAYKFKLTWIHATSHSVELHENIHVTWHNL